MGGCPLIWDGAPTHFLQYPVRRRLVEPVEAEPGPPHGWSAQDAEAVVAGLNDFSGVLRDAGEAPATIGELMECARQHAAEIRARLDDEG